MEFLETFETFETLSEVEHTSKNEKYLQLNGSNQMSGSGTRQQIPESEILSILSKRKTFKILSAQNGTHSREEHGQHTHKFKRKLTLSASKKDDERKNFRYKNVAIWLPKFTQRERSGSWVERWFEGWI